MTETNHAAIGADALCAAERLLRRYAAELRDSHTSTRDRSDWAGAEDAKADYDEYLRAADGLAAITSAAQLNNDWAQSAAELIAVRGYLADSADTPRVAHLLAQIVPATQRLPTTQAAPQHAAQGDALDAARWRYAVAIGGNQVMNWLNVYDDWNGEGYFADAIDAARAKEGDSNA